MSEKREDPFGMTSMVETCEKLGFKGAAIRLLDDDREELKLVASHGLSEVFLEKGCTTTTDTAQRALKGETIIISDSTTDNSITFKAAMKKEGIVSMFVTPIMVREKAIGVLRLYSDVQRQFPDDDMLMVKALAHQGGLAIQNSSMFLQLEKTRNHWKKISGAIAPGFSDLEMLFLFLTRKAFRLGTYTPQGDTKKSTLKGIKNNTI